LQTYLVTRERAFSHVLQNEVPFTHHQSAFSWYHANLHARRRPEYQLSCGAKKGPSFIFRK